MPQPRKNERAERMYALYQDGYSLGQVALAWGVSRQSVYDVFKRRGYQLRARRFLPTIMYKGDKYAQDPDGYYRKTSGDRSYLHQLVWIEHNGPIPDGHEIHHQDRDKINNAPENLVCLSPTDHAQIHQVFRGVPEKHCLWCDSILIRKREPSGKLQTPAAVTRRAYCNTACHAAQMRSKPPA